MADVGSCGCGDRNLSRRRQTSWCQAHRAWVSQHHRELKPSKSVASALDRSRFLFSSPYSQIPVLPAPLTAVFSWRFLAWQPRRLPIILHFESTYCLLGTHLGSPRSWLDDPEGLPMIFSPSMLGLSSGLRGHSWLPSPCMSLSGSQAAYHPGKQPGVTCGAGAESRHPPAAHRPTAL